MARAEECNTLNKTLFNVLRIKNTPKTMKTTKNCKYCYQLFESRRSNHVYCTTSCKTKASYKRNNYTYVPGHYQKQMVNDEIILKDKSLGAVFENKTNNKGGINSSSISNAAIGAATADVALFAAKKLFAPNTLPATKGDIKLLTEKLVNKYHLIKNLSKNIEGESPYFDIDNQVVVYFK